jgi:hypothetical protein
MSPKPQPETILAHPALAGRTLLAQHGEGWAAFDIQTEGRLGEARPVPFDPSESAWRGGAAR